MSKKHEIVCDRCGTIAPLKFNGEHWLPASEWVEFYHESRAQMLGIHLCNLCFERALERPINAGAQAR